MKQHPGGKSPTWASVDSRVLGRQNISMVDYKAPVEKPLRIVLYGQENHDLGLYMRTPGKDLELITGLLFNEGVISGPRDISSIEIQDDVATVLMNDADLEFVSSHDLSLIHI